MVVLLDMPVCVLKVNLRCCDECPRKVMKKLQKINGVLAININPEKGLVFVCGIVGPAILKNKFAKIGKRAEIYIYEKFLRDAKMKHQHLLQDGLAQIGGEDSDDEDDDHANPPQQGPIINNASATYLQNPESVMEKMKKCCFGLFRRKKVERRMARPPPGFAYPPPGYAFPPTGYEFPPQQQPPGYAFQPPGYESPPQQQPPGYEFPPQQPPPGLAAPQDPPVTYNMAPPPQMRIPPLPYLNNFNEPVGNSTIVPLFSDANAHSCSIM